MTEDPTKDKEAIDDYFLRLIGKVEVPELLEKNNNFKVVIQGAITEIRDKNREDGGRILTSIFEPVIVETIDHLGKTLKAKDPRSDSKLWHAQLYAIWKERQLEMTDEEFYHYVMNWLRRNADEIIEQVLREL